MRYGTTFRSIPSASGPGEYNVYASITAWDDDDCCVSFDLGWRSVSGLPDVHTTTDVNEWAVDWADRFYKIATEIFAEAKNRADRETNARPSDASVPS